MRKILVCGGRDFRDDSRIYAVLGRLHMEDPIGLLITGCAQGADLHAEDWARDNEVAYVGVPAQWKIYGKAAGPRRNARMLSDWHRPAKPIDLVLAFPGGTGTAHMIGLAQAAGIAVERG